MHTGRLFGDGTTFSKGKSQTTNKQSIKKQRFYLYAEVKMYGPEARDVGISELRFRGSCGRGWQLSLGGARSAATVAASCCEGILSRTREMQGEGGEREGRGEEREPP